MAARAMWKGVIRFGGVELPVKLYSAIQDRAVHFNLLNTSDRKPVRQHMVASDSGDVVEPEAIRKGYVDDNGFAVMLDDDEIEALAPKPSRDIDISKFAEIGAFALERATRRHCKLGDAEARIHGCTASARRLSDARHISPRG